MEEIIKRIVEELKNVVGLEGLAIVGSRALGVNDESADLDIALYYTGEGVLDITTLSNMISNLDDGKRPGLTTMPGAYGPWLNGGATFYMNQKKVDILFRNLSKVNEVFEKYTRGEFGITYQGGHPFGYLSTAYLAEINYGKILFEKRKVITEVKKKILPMRDMYRKSLAVRFIWEAEYGMQTAMGAARDKDIIYAVGALYRAANSLAEVIYVLNNQFMTTEKLCFNKIKTFRYVPEGFVMNMEKMFMAIDTRNINDAYNLMNHYIAAVKTMAGEQGLL